MPNWCNNNVYVEHEDKSMIRRLIQAFNGEGLFNGFFPVPEELWLKEFEISSETAKEQLSVLHKSNIDKYGYKDWYDWSIANWGIKWDVRNHLDKPIDENDVCLCFDSPWSPPIRGYEKLMGLGFKIKAYYYEPSMGFCGVMEDGIDYYYDLPSTSDEVDGAIPSAINEEFGISELMDMWKQTS